MNKMKWHAKLLIGLVIVVFSPLILASFICAAIYILIQILKNRKEYKRSRYYLDFNQKFMIGVLHAPEYRFYNSAVHRHLPIQYIKQESNGFEYFLLNDVLFLFPDFEQIDYDTEKEEWQVDYDGDWSSFDSAYCNLLAKLDTSPELPVRLFVEREMFPAANLNNLAIPECIFVTREYENAFENEDSPLKMIIPQTSEELYEMMLQTPNLCGHFELSSDNENVIWDLYPNIRIKIGVDAGNCYFGVSKMLFEKFESGITHWHPSPFEIYGEVCKIGKCGNVMVIRTFLCGARVLYRGNKEDCLYQKGKGFLFGKLYYLEAK